MTLADKIVVMNKGRIEQVGSPMELYNSPQTLFVAGFIGSPQMNLVEGAKLGDPAAKTVGIRPEHIQVNNTSGTWKGSVIHVEHLGADTIIYLQTDFGPLTVRLFGEHQYEVDQVLYATPDAGRTYRFDDKDQIIKA